MSNATPRLIGFRRLRVPFSSVPPTPREPLPSPPACANDALGKPAGIRAGPSDLATRFRSILKGIEDARLRRSRRLVGSAVAMQHRAEAGSPTLNCATR
eukprot:CAMPEP_0205927340 /NCGR_PEP_ID=MMETSP1325-20131115/22401_1 /ASSEMBLY_ACC=CAM_ASM_000708 /TAXON_ID=236786 /ORGANISM="Florenciella sp., Strain RCC1007" /LENGTH=98 /DNA_ID=CAMNT_0053296201 /DNA_START=210 /DNA_END=502 /DNA_ORIENTATION=-